MPKALRQEIELEYEVFGSRVDEPLLLIMGLGAQMILWDEDFCERLAQCGHRVIRFDNRDVGLSTWLDDLGVPDMPALMGASVRGEEVEAPYSLDDMADDAIAILDALGHEQAHICGASMGGMIAQTVAMRHPARARSLISIMSTTGNRELPPANPEAMTLLASPPPAERQAFIDQSLVTDRVIGSPAYPSEESFLRERAARLYDRAFHPSGATRQMAAILAHGDRRPGLRELDLPTLVIHGKDDPLVPVEGGIDTHEAISDSELMLIDGMGHNLPRELYGQVIEGITALTRPGACDP
jgi:pimeloyl-ACP methyl ester carboxylesterase